MNQREDEIFLLLEGALTIWTGYQRQELLSHGVALLPKGRPQHSAWRSAPN
jgi:hypothetical protein